MLKIIRVGALDGNRLDIELSNGNMILFDLGPYLNDPQFAELAKNNTILYPRTDGNRIYWRNGTSLTIKEILKQIQKP